MPAIAIASLMVGVLFAAQIITTRGHQGAAPAAAPL